MGTRITTYNQNPKKVDEIVSYQVNGLKYYPHTDMLGSVCAVSDVTTKAIATWTYDVYGARTQATDLGLPVLVTPAGSTTRTPGSSTPEPGTTTPSSGSG